MIDKDFNAVQRDVLFSYTPGLVQDKSFQILKKTAQGGVKPVGDYLVLDANESPKIRDKMIINLISILNGQDPIDLSSEIGSRLLYNKIPSQGDKSKIMFYRYNGEGVSIENALLTIDQEDMYNG